MSASGPPTSSEIIAYSTFTSASIIMASGESAEVSGDIPFDSIIIKNWHAHSNATDFSIGIYNSSNKAVTSTVVSIRSTITENFVSIVSDEIVYRDADGTKKLHLAAGNNTGTTTVIVTAYYTTG